MGQELIKTIDGLFLPMHPAKIQEVEGKVYGVSDRGIALGGNRDNVGYVDQGAMLEFMCVDGRMQELDIPDSSYFPHLSKISGSKDFNELSGKSVILHYSPDFKEFYGVTFPNKSTQ